MGWFSAPFVSSRLPDLPVLHTIMHGIASLKDGVFQTYAAELGKRGGEYLVTVQSIFSSWFALIWREIGKGFQ